MKIPADRYGLRLEQRLTSQLDAQLEGYRVRRQTDTAAYETETGAYTMLGAGVSYRGFGPSDTRYLLYARAAPAWASTARREASP